MFQQESLLTKSTTTEISQKSDCLSVVGLRSERGVNTEELKYSLSNCELNVAVTKMNRCTIDYTEITSQAVTTELQQSRLSVSLTPGGYIIIPTFLHYLYTTVCNRPTRLRYHIVGQFNSRRLYNYTDVPPLLVHHVVTDRHDYDTTLTPDGYIIIPTFLHYLYTTVCNRPTRLRYHDRSEANAQPPPSLPATLTLMSQNPISPRRSAGQLFSLTARGTCLTHHWPGGRRVLLSEDRVSYCTHKKPSPTVNEGNEAPERENGTKTKGS
ncbi:hypothetical protein J6590_053514 [Homalodisca vitripennis]|nr:hypothetical protein J6590_053514 [Homalodisca vitripennis]